MRRRIATICLTFAWICANGALLDVAQVFAWVKMVRSYSQVMPLAHAVEITFDGSAPCELCTLVAKAKEKSPRQEAPRSEERVLLACTLPERIVLDPPRFTRLAGEDATGCSREIEVPVPPPRC